MANNNQEGKKAYLAKFVITTRIVLPDGFSSRDDFEQAAADLGAKTAVNQLQQDGSQTYLVEVVEDSECPYGTLPDDKDNSQNPG